MAGAWGTSELLAACCGPAVKLWNPVSADKAQQAETKLNEGTTVHALDWSSNNKVLAVAGEKAQVSMYGNGQMIGQIPNLPTPSIDGITSVRFGSDSKRMVIGCKNRSLHVLDLRQQGSGAKSNVDHKAPVCSLAISPDDAIIASASTGGQLLLHDFKTSSKLMALSSDAIPKRSLTFCPADGQLLAAAADDGSVCVWNVKTRLPVHELQKQHKGPASGVSFAPDSSSVLYTCGRDHKLALVDIRRQQEVAVQTQQPLASVCARFDGRLLAAGTTGGVVLLFDVRKLGQSLASYGFSEQAPVTEVRWQHAPKSRDKAKAAAVAAATASAGTAPSGPMPSSSIGLDYSHRNVGGVGGSSALRHEHSGDLANGSGRGLPAHSAPPQEESQGSDLNMDSDQMRAVSPVHHMGTSPTEDTTSAAAGSMYTAATPSNDTSLTSGISGMAPYMVTPGFGVTRGLPSDAVDATPTSRAGPGALRAGDYGQPPGTRTALSNGTQRLNKGDPTAASQPPKPPISTNPAATAHAPTAQASAPRPPVAPAPAASTAAGAAGGPAARPPSRGDSAVKPGPSAGTGRVGQPAAAAPGDSAAAARPAAAQEAAGAAGPSFQQQQQRQQVAAGVHLPSSLQAAGIGHVGGGLGLKEDIFKAYVDESIGGVRQDIRDLHLEMLRQFHQAQMDLMSLVEGVVARQDELAQRVEQLSSKLERLGGRNDLLSWL